MHPLSRHTRNEAEPEAQFMCIMHMIDLCFTIAYHKLTQSTPTPKAKYIFQKQRRIRCLNCRDR